VAPGILGTIGVVATLAMAISLFAGVMNLQKSLQTAEGSITGFFRMSVLFILIFTILRSVAVLPPVQKMVGYTWFNILDITVDAQTYGMLAFVGAAYLIVNRLLEKEVSGSGLVYTLILAGSALIVVANVLHGFIEAGALMRTAEDGSFAVSSWSDVVFSGSAGKEGAMKYLLSLRGLAFLGYGAILVGAAYSALSIIGSFLNQEKSA
jgi:cbb3-type cytochrome oxidase subunit 1